MGTDLKRSGRAIKYMAILSAFAILGAPKFLIAAVGVFGLLACLALGFGDDRDEQDSACVTEPERYMP